MLPMGADQPYNAQRCAELGVGEVLDAANSTPRQVCDAAERLLESPDYRDRAERFAKKSTRCPTLVELFSKSKTSRLAEYRVAHGSGCHP
ncbi:MAG: hypothetical protein WA580_01110 [Acidimicrobiales bacterium]